MGLGSPLASDEDDLWVRRKVEVVGDRPADADLVGGLEVKVFDGVTLARSESMADVGPKPSLTPKTVRYMDEGSGSSSKETEIRQSTGTGTSQASVDIRD